MAQQATDETQLRQNQARAVDGVDVPVREAARLESDEVAAGIMMAAGEVAKSPRARREVARNEGGRLMPVLALVLTVAVGTVLAAVAIALLLR